MKPAPLISCAIGVIGLWLFTYLLTAGFISEVIYASLLFGLAFVCIAVLCLPRIAKLDLKRLKMTLTELERVKSEIEEVKSEVAQMYGGIENIRKTPLVLDEAKLKELGLNNGGVAFTSSVMRYTAGCFKRERERLASIFISPKAPKEQAQAILDGTLDDKIFKWNGPETPLDALPKSATDHERED